MHVSNGTEMIFFFTTRHVNMRIRIVNGRKRDENGLLNESCENFLESATFMILYNVVFHECVWMVTF